MGHTYSVYDHRRKLPSKENQSGVYIVVDVVYMTTTTIQAFANGANSVTVHPDVEKLHPDGNKLFTDYEDIGYDNRPTETEAHVNDGDNIFLQSHNGARTVNMISKDCDLYLASTTNAKPLATYLEDRYEEDTHFHIVSAGVDGDLASEDVAGVASVFFAASEDTLNLDGVEEHLLKSAYDTMDFDHTDPDFIHPTEFHKHAVVPVRHSDAETEAHYFTDALAD